MNKIIAIVTLLATALCASAAAPKKLKTPEKPTPPTVQPLVIPKDAVQNPDGSYSYTDKAGKKWIYTNTPFGVSRKDDMTANGTPSPFATTPKEQLIKATDAGDVVKFEKKTPFGTTKWEKKKTDLTDEERGILANQTADQSANQTAKPEQQ